MSRVNRLRRGVDTNLKTVDSRRVDLNPGYFPSCGPNLKTIDSKQSNTKGCVECSGQNSKPIDSRQSNTKGCVESCAQISKAMDSRETTAKPGCFGSCDSGSRISDCPKSNFIQGCYDNPGHSRSFNSGCSLDSVQECEDGFSGSSATLYLDRGYFRGNPSATGQSVNGQSAASQSACHSVTHKANIQSPEMCEVHSVVSSVDLRRQCEVESVTTSLLDEECSSLKEFVRNDYEESQCSFLHPHNACSTTDSDSDSTLLATGPLKGAGDTTTLESLGYYDGDWNGNYEVLYDWIDQMDFVKNQKNVHRDFSDGVLMAELLKKLWPKLVDLHNYSPANSFHNKLANWVTLNSKVFRRLKLLQPLNTLQDLARAEPGVLETLLGKVKRKHERSKLTPTPPASVVGEEHSTIVLNGKKMHKNDLTGMIDRCKRLEAEIAEGDEVIKMLRNKVTHLEFLLQDKDAKIAELKSELSRYQFGPLDTNPPPASCVSSLGCESAKAPAFSPYTMGTLAPPPSICTMASQDPSVCPLGNVDSIRPGCVSEPTNVT